MFDPRTLPGEASRLPVDKLPELIGALAEAAAIAQRRLAEPSRPEPTDAPDVLLDADAMAARLSIRASWLLEMARQGRVPHVRLGKFVRFRPSEVLAWAAKREAQDG